MAKIEVCFTPDTYGVYSNNEHIVVVTDILRATSAISTALHHGAKEIIPVSTIEEARAYKKKGYLVGAERNAVQLEEFDFGNSPYSYMNDDIKGKSIVLTTTNGTRAIDLAKNSYQVVIGAFTNFDAVVDYLAASGRDILILCSGWKGRYNLEDTIYGGAITQALERKGVLTEIEDSALSAMYLYEMGMDDPYKFLMNSSHRRRLKNLNLKEDIRYCLSLNRTDVIPIYKDGKLIPLRELQLMDKK